MKKRIISLLLAACMLVGLVPAWNLSASAADMSESTNEETLVADTVAETPTSGTCGKNLSWSFSSDGTLTISGTGEMDDFNEIYPNDTSPWCSLKSSIKRIEIENGVTSIGDWAFDDFVNLTSVTIPDSVTSIGDKAFVSCSNLTSVSIPDSVTNIGDYAFYGCSKLYSVIIPDSVTSIGARAFSDCTRLTNVTIPSSVTELLVEVFSNCTSLRSITIPDSVTTIQMGAFGHCSNLTSILIPNSVTSIESSAFYSCTNLSYVAISNSVTSIASGAFSNCDKLTDVFFDGSKEEWSKIEIGSDNDSLLNATIHYKDQDVSPFVDIQNPKDFFYAPVLWAASNSITYGVDDTHFAPHQSCTRSQVVAFLWRAMDCPEPTTTECPFVDVKPSDFFYKAMLWAVENKIAYGVDSTHFDPSATVTRADFVTFLWRAQNRPGSTKSSFVDIPANSYYTTAINWAAENKVAYGTDDTHFSPTFPCTRGQVVTFLYRNLA